MISAYSLSLIGILVFLLFCVFMLAAVLPFRRSVSRLASVFDERFSRIAKSFTAGRRDISADFAVLSARTEDNFTAVRNYLTDESRKNREELSRSLEKINAEIRILVSDSTSGMEKIRETLDQRLTAIQRNSDEKLEKIRQTVDEKLHDTLEKRLGESFKLVSMQLKNVQEGLGEMRSVATEVGDLKKVLSNVKTKGILGEYQLGALLEEYLHPSQYETNFAAKTGSRDVVEFAIRLPAKEKDGSYVYLPVDSKFPSENYSRLLSAYDKGNRDDISRYREALAKDIRAFAKDIQTKYIDVPRTTEFGIMFLPFEGLYAEVLRIDGLLEQIQRTYHITITGPTTILAFLNSLQMGFRCLTVEKRTGEIWKILGAVRTEFGKFGEVLEKTKEKLVRATEELDQTGVRTRAIERKLRNVESLPEDEAAGLLGTDDL